VVRFHAIGVARGAGVDHAGRREVAVQYSGLGGVHANNFTREFTEDFVDDFEGPELDPHHWIDHYLPHWTTPDRSRARYDFVPGSGSDGASGLRLRIDADQPAWLDHSDGMRVSNIQTGSFSGARGSARGIHRSDPTLVVRTPVATERLWTPSAGRVDVTLRANADPTCMVAVWLVGFEERSPDDSGEICIAELFGDAITPDHARINLGIKAHRDPRLLTKMVQPVLPIDATQPHSYGAEWNSSRVHFFVDDNLVHTIDHGINYPMQLMVDLFEFPRGGDGSGGSDAARDPADYPKTAVVHGVRGSSLAIR
jgi:hypothetical protein